MYFCDREFQTLVLYNFVRSFIFCGSIRRNSTTATTKNAEGDINENCWRCCFPGSPWTGTNGRTDVRIDIQFTHGTMTTQWWQWLAVGRSMGDGLWCGDERHWRTPPLSSFNCRYHYWFLLIPCFGHYFCLPFQFFPPIEVDNMRSWASPSMDSYKSYEHGPVSYVGSFFLNC